MMLPLGLIWLLSRFLKLILLKFLQMEFNHHPRIQNYVTHLTFVKTFWFKAFYEPVIRYLVSWYCQTPLQHANPTQLVWVGVDFVFQRKKKEEEGRKNNTHLAFSRRKDPTCLNFGDCIVGVWRVYGNCPKGVWQVSGGCLAGVFWLPGGCLNGVWKVS